MKWIESSVKYVPQDYTEIGLYKHIEVAMRNCYQSGDQIDDESYKRMMKIAYTNKHYSPFEHATVYLKLQVAQAHLIGFFTNNKYSRINFKDDKYYVTTNFRVLVENDMMEALNYMCEPTDYHDKRTTFLVTCSIGVSREWNRHRTMSISEQSTRYCNYHKDKFGNELTFVKPYWCTDSNLVGLTYLKMSHKRAEEDYLNLIELGYKPQEARSVLPLDLATTVYYTAFDDDWRNFIWLRTSSGAHPDICKLAHQIEKHLDGTRTSL